MGRGIAQVAATAGHEVLLFDTNGKALEVARNAIDTSLQKLLKKGKISSQDSKAIFGRIYFIEHLTSLSETSLVIEAIVENLDIKQGLFREIEQIVDDSCILASNTSSLSITSIAASLSNPGRFVGLHFFNPAPIMKLVEVVPAMQSDTQTVDAAFRLMESWGKVAVRVKDTPAFIVNRIARPFYGEALRILEEGIADVATIDWAMTELGNFRMGPFALMDFIGNDVNYTITEIVFHAFYNDPRYKPSFTQKRMVEAGWLGRKSGKGYYDYSDGAALLSPTEDRNLGGKILRRILVMLINEAADAVFWGIASKEDIELAMTKGVNYPKGLLHWADELSLGLCVQELDLLYDTYREDRYRCSPLLRRMAADVDNFFVRE